MEEAYLVMEDGRRHPPEFSDEKLASLGRLAAEKSSVLEWYDAEPLDESPLTSKGQAVVVTVGAVPSDDDHNRVNGEASHKPASSTSEPIGIAMGSGAVFVPQVEANEKEMTGLLFEDMPLTFGVVLAVSVDLAESTRTDCGLDRRVGESISKLSLFLMLYLLYI